MFSKIKSKFKSNPSLFYAMSIAATWAGVNSLIGGVEFAQGNGILPYMLWAAGNILACVVFGIFAERIPKLREVFRSRAMKIVVGLLCPFQVWINLNGIHTVFADTPLGSTFGKIAAYLIAAAFIIALFRRGMIRNVLTDHASWVCVYALIIALTVIAFIFNGSQPLSIGTDNIMSGLHKGVLLLPGPFLYPYFFEILDYNDANGDGTKKIDIKRAFTLGGILFGVYLVFAFALAFTSFGAVTGIIKAVLITLIAISSLSSFQYSIYLTFGRKLGIGINVLAVILWQFLIPLGVMGAWTLMSTLRIFIVIAAIAAAIVWNLVEKSEGVKK